jgi:hypothetical protein
MSLFSTWRKRALDAEAKISVLNAALDVAREHLEGIEIRFTERAVLVSIVQTGRVNRFTFVRNGQTHVVETYSTMEDDVPGWKSALLGEG